MDIDFTALDLIEHYCTQCLITSFRFFFSSFVFSPLLITCTPSTSLPLHGITDERIIHDAFSELFIATGGSAPGTHSTLPFLVLSTYLAHCSLIICNNSLHLHSCFFKYIQDIIPMNLVYNETESHIIHVL